MPALERLLLVGRPECSLFICGEVSPNLVLAVAFLLSGRPVHVLCGIWKSAFPTRFDCGAFIVGGGSSGFGFSSNEAYGLREVCRHIHVNTLIDSLCGGIVRPKQSFCLEADIVAISV